MQPRCVILGGGGHAGVLLDLLLDTGGAEGCVVLDSDRACWGQTLFGVPILGGDDRLPHLVLEHVTHFVVGIGSLGDSHLRERLYHLGLGHGLHPLTLIHPKAFCSRRANPGAGAQILAGAVVNTGAHTGVNVLVNSAAVVEHDCFLGDHVHIATGARLAGGVRVGDGAHVGAGATVLQGRKVGARAIVGAGAVVIHDVEPGTVVVGVPARIQRTIARVKGET